MNFVFFMNGLVLLFSAGLMGIDSLLFPETREVFADACLLTGTVGLMISLASASTQWRLRRLYTFVLTASVWMTAAAAGALPLFLWKLSPADAMFEAMSGITTTGSTVMSGLDETPHGILLWRAILQGVGGVGFIVTGIALLPILKVGGMQLFRTESSDKDEKELSNAAAFASATLAVYLGLIVLCGVVYVAGGMNLFDATVHALTTLSSGGYSNYDASFGHFDSPFLQWAATVFMVLGALPFAWYVRAINRRVLHSEQVIGMVSGLAVVIVLMALWLYVTSNQTLFSALTLVAFNVVSVVTTTGYATTDYTLWGPFAVTVFFILTGIGGCTGSTAGGAKIMRWIILVRMIRTRIRTIHTPHGVFATKYEGRPIGEDVLSGVISFFTLYFATFGVLSFALAFTGLDIATSVSGALTALANVGPGLGATIGPAGNFASLSDTAKVLLLLGMYLGRLEILTIYVLLTAAFWREVRLSH